MKISLSISLVVALLSESTEALNAVRRLDSCGVVNNVYGTGSNLDDERGNSAVTVLKGNKASCTVYCDSASGLQLYIGYGPPGQSNKGNAEASNTAMTCGATLEATNADGSGGFEFIVVATSFTNMRVECGCPTTDQTPAAAGCFSSTDTVQVLNRGETAMKDLMVGDKVLTPGGDYEPVYSFGHYHETHVADFVKLETKQDDTLTLTPDHMIYANGDKSNPVRADTVQIGDQLSSGTVRKVSIVAKQGLYMPLTPSGTILVGNVAASAYVSMAEYAPIKVHPLLNFWLTEHNLVHLWLSPFRMYCMGVKSHYCPGHAKNVEGDEGIMGHLLLGKRVAEFALEQNMLVQVLLGVPVFGTLLAFRTVEVATGPVLAPIAIFFMVVGLLQLCKSSTGGRQGKKKSV